MNETIDISKVKKGDLIRVRKKQFINKYEIGEVIGVSLKSNTISVKYGDYCSSYNSKYGLGE